MRAKALILFHSVLAFGFLTGIARSAPAPRERILFNDDWRFTKGDPANAGDTLSYAKLKDVLLASSETFTSNAPPLPAPPEIGRDVAYTAPGFDDKEWRKLSLPHDWGIEGPFDLYLPGETAKLPWFGVAWYRKHFTIPATDAKRQVYLDIDGAMSNAIVWCNGRFVGGWPYGYNSFRLDLTPHLKVGGENVLAVRLDNPNESSRWYPGAGLYRNVWLTKTSPIHVSQWGAFVTTPKVDTSSATVNVDVKIDNRSDKAADLKIDTSIHQLNESKGVVSRALIARAPLATAKAAAAKFTDVSQSVNVPKPKLWSTESPNRYVAVIRIADSKNTLLDTYEVPFGIRTAQFDADRGFLLNDKVVPLKGVCEHHDLGALGAAFNTRAMERKLENLKAMGVNALRTSHNPPAPEVLDLCDRMGILVFDEAFDCWKRAKKPNGYNLLFDDWSGRDLRALILRDRNHPSVVAWSIGNEIIEQKHKEGEAMGKALTEIVHASDPTRPSTLGCNHTPAGFSGYQKGVDVFGYNYRGEHFPEFHKKNPTQPVYGSETSSAISSRGFYVFPVGNKKEGGKKDFQMSSYDLYAPSWGRIPDDEFRYQDASPAFIGEFVWTGHDYLGEPTPYSTDDTNLLNLSDPAAREKLRQEQEAAGKKPMPSRSSYFGILDLAGFPKDRYYLYQSHWRPEFPMAHLLPHWNWPDRIGQVTPVHLYTSGDEAELFLNGKSLGRKKKGENEYRLRWDDVVYEPGELKAVAYKQGKQWATDIVKTTGEPKALKLSADRPLLTASGTDLAFITLRVNDAKGLAVPTVNSKIRFEVTGPAELVATDNGDATDHTVFSSPERKMFNGLALAIVRPKAGNGGEITVKATAEGLEPATLTMKAASAKN